VEVADHFFTSEKKKKKKKGIQQGGPRDRRGRNRKRRK